ncbi:hypothetical protein EHQ61_14885 [Leptospira wolffii]|nr:hypothetical protein EHQ61_14885 [Leptospira wolffii]
MSLALQSKSRAKSFGLAKRRQALVVMRNWAKNSCQNVEKRILYLFYFLSNFHNNPKYIRLTDISVVQIY